MSIPIDDPKGTIRINDPKGTNRYSKICISKTLKGTRCTKHKIYNSNGILLDYCLIHNNIHNPTICSICMESISNKQIMETCKHEFCVGCVNKWLIRNETCPYCRTEVTSNEKQICTIYGISIGQFINVNFITYSIEELTLEEKLTFNEYLEVCFQEDKYYTIGQWNLILEYINAFPEISELFYKYTRYTETKLFKKHLIEEYIERLNNLFLRNDEVKIHNDMSLIRIKIN
jgi:hypothetical protein